VYEHVQFNTATFNTSVLSRVTQENGFVSPGIPPGV
jgi:hypothetical protein